MKGCVWVGVNDFEAGAGYVMVALEGSGVGVEGKALFSS